jgi:hypothetical protein
MVLRITGLHLCETAIHKRFRPSNVATVVGCEKHPGLGDHESCDITGTELFADGGFAQV